jgi:hypothetical protein
VGRGFFLISNLIIDDWVELNATRMLLVFKELTGLGLDMRFLGGKWQKKIDGDGNWSRMSGLALPLRGRLGKGLLFPEILTRWLSRDDGLRQTPLQLWSFQWAVTADLFWG